MLRLFATLLAALTLSACAAAGGGHYETAPSALGAREADAAPAARLLIRRASQRVEVEDPAAVAPRVVAVVEQAGGYVERSDIEHKKRSYMTLRVPSAKLDAVLVQLAALGEEKARELSSEDVTDQYRDLEARLNNARALRERLRELTRRATVVKELIELERELARVQTEIDTLEGQLKRMAGQVQLAQVGLTLEPRRIYGPLGYLVFGLGALLEKLFVIQ